MQGLKSFAQTVIEAWNYNIKFMGQSIDSAHMVITKIWLKFRYYKYEIAIQYLTLPDFKIMYR